MHITFSIWTNVPVPDVLQEQLHQGDAHDVHQFVTLFYASQVFKKKTFVQPMQRY